MERTRTPSDNWDTREFATPLPPAAKGAASKVDHEQRAAAIASSSSSPQREKKAAVTANAAPANRQLHEPAARFTIRPPSRSLGKYTLRQSSPPSDLFANMASNSSSSSGSLFELSSSNSHYGTALEGSESDASMDAEVASLTSGRRLGNGVEGLLRAVDAPARPRPAASRMRDAGSASVALLALLSPSTESQRERKPAPRCDSATQQEGGVWGVEPAAKRRRTRKVPSPMPGADMKE